MKDSVFMRMSDAERVFKSRARSASQPRRVSGPGGEWVTVHPLPVLGWLDVQAAYMGWGGRCKWCRKFCGLSGTLEHVVRIASGGTNDAGNLAWACKRCNQKGYWR